MQGASAKVSLQTEVDCAKYPVGLRARGLAARRERPNALHSFRDPRLRARHARRVSSASLQRQFGFVVESGLNCASSETLSTARYS
jgi:hypothetical protein